MKANTIVHLVSRLLFVTFLASCLALPLQQAQAQDRSYQDNSDLESSEIYSRGELSQMLAPIALYPDALLSQILMASTYPIEVIEADRWIRKELGLNGDALNTALLDKDWDPSVKAVCHFPSILALMSERITETTNLGNAFLAQEAEVMDIVQEMRAKAYTHGNLTTTSKQKIIVENETIIIESPDPRVIYVPYYDPFYIYGSWWYPTYPPYYWGPLGVSIGIGISYWPGFYFGFAYANWSYFDWPHRYIYIDMHKRPRFVRHDRWFSKPGRWHHHPRHRRSVAYRDKSTARKYGQYPYRSRHFRRDTRGFPKFQHQDERRDDRASVERGRQERKRIDQDKKVPKRVERGRQERKRIDQDKKVPKRVERGRQERKRIDQDKKVPKRVERGRQERKRIDQDKKVPKRVERGRQERKRIDQDKKVPKRVERGRQERKRIDQDKKVPKRVERGRQERKRIDQDKKVPKRVERGRQERKRIDQDKKVPKRVERKQLQKSHNNIFNRVEDGRSKLVSTAIS